MEPPCKETVYLIVYYDTQWRSFTLPTPPACMAFQEYLAGHYVIPLARSSSNLKFSEGLKTIWVQLLSPSPQSLPETSWLQSCQGLRVVYWLMTRWALGNDRYNKCTLVVLFNETKHCVRWCSGEEQVWAPRERGPVNLQATLGCPWVCSGHQRVKCQSLIHSYELIIDSVTNR